MGDHDSKHAKQVLWQKHWPLVALHGWEARLEQCKYLVVYMTRYEHFLNLAELGLLLHRVPQR